MIQKWVLDNGAHILFDTVDNTDSVCVGFWFNCGSRDERPARCGGPTRRGACRRSDARRRAAWAAERGFTHFLEHMLFKGTERRTAFQIAKEIDRVGGFLNAFTEREATCFFATLPCEHLELAVNVLSDMIFHSVLDSGEIEKEKSVVINEVLSVMDSPEELAHESYLTNLWGEHPLAWRITGSVEDVKKIDRERLLTFYKQRFVPENLTISVAGRFDAARVFELIGNTVNHRDGLSGQASAASAAMRRCDRAHASNAGFLAARTTPKKESSWQHKKDRFKQVQIYTGTDLPIQRGKHRPLYDALVFSNAVGESMSSRLFQQIREVKALCYSISSYRTIFTDISLWTIYCNTSPDTVRKLLGALDEELRRLLSEPLTEIEVEDAKNHLMGTLILAKEDMEGRMKRLYRLHSLVGEIIEYEESLKLINEVDRKRILLITDQWMQKRDFSLLAFGGGKIKNFNDLRFEY